MNLAKLAVRAAKKAKSSVAGVKAAARAVKRK